ncbi:MAG: hypothetical protein WCJ30_08765 [Deltaproteobacteria bacterium]
MISIEARTLAMDLVPSLPDTQLRTRVSEIDALAELPGALADDVAQALDDAVARRFPLRRALPADLLGRLVERYGEDRVPEVAGRYARLRSAADQEAGLRSDPDVMREHLRQRAEMQRCVDECLQEPDVCTGVLRRRRAFVVRGRPVLIVTQRRVTAPCSIGLSTCQTLCGFDESDPEWAGER